MVSLELQSYGLEGKFYLFLCETCTRCIFVVQLDQFNEQQILVLTFDFGMDVFEMSFKLFNTK